MWLCCFSFGGVDTLLTAWFKSILRRYDYKIQYNDISKLFLLEKPDDRYVAFVISLDKPIRQGQKKYQHLVLRTTKVRSQTIGHPRYFQGPLAGVFRHAVLSHVFHAGTPNVVVSALRHLAHAARRQVDFQSGFAEGHSMLLARGTLENRCFI